MQEEPGLTVREAGFAIQEVCRIVSEVSLTSDQAG
jgi:hypothetical protein